MFPPLSGHSQLLHRIIGRTEESQPTIHSQLIVKLQLKTQAPRIGPLLPSPAAK